MKWVSEARSQINKTLSRLSLDFAESTKETAIALLSEELKKIPVPFVGTILSRTFEKALASKDTGGPSIEDVLQNLQYMQLSDDDFLRGLTDLGEDVGRLNELIKSTLENLTNKLSVPELIIDAPEYRPNYPISDNELRFGLMNKGAGSVRVPEINLVVENWQPDTKVVYTVPAAPPEFLFLKVRLTPKKSHYPLLQLNNEPFRRFYASSVGAEDICIQMSSETNARYYVRIRIPHREIDTDQDKEVVYPSLDEPPLSVSFPYAPGWNSHITPANILERGAVFADIISTFGEAKVLLEGITQPSDTAYREIIDEKLREIGFSMGLCYMGPVLNRFIDPVTQMMKEESSLGALKVIFELAHQCMRYYEGRFEFDDEPIDALCSLIDKQDVVEQVHLFFKEQDGRNRQRILAEISGAI